MVRLPSPQTAPAQRRAERERVPTGQAQAGGWGHRGRCPEATEGRDRHPGNHSYGQAWHCPLPSGPELLLDDSCAEDQDGELDGLWTTISIFITLFLLSVCYSATVTLFKVGVPAPSRTVARCPSAGDPLEPCHPHTDSTLTPCCPHADPTLPPHRPHADPTLTPRCPHAAVTLTPR